MDISQINNGGIQDMLAHVYVPNPTQSVNAQDNEGKIEKLENLKVEGRTVHLSKYSDMSNIADKFSPSEELKKAYQIGDGLKGSFNNKDSFDNLTSTLMSEGLITSNERIAMDYLKDTAPKLSFDEFNKIAISDNHSKEMKGLLKSVINTMDFIDNVNGGVLRGI